MVQEHTVKIGKHLFYGQAVTMPIPVKKRQRMEVKIEGGKPKWYYGPYDLRQFKFKATLYTTPGKAIKIIEDVTNKTVKFSSVYIGTFNAMVEQEGSIEDGVPGVVYITFDIQEC